MQNCVTLKLTAVSFDHNFAIQTQNRVIQVLKRTGIGLVYNPTQVESQNSPLFSRKRNFCARGLLFHIFRHARFEPLKIRPPMHLNQKKDMKIILEHHLDQYGPFQTIWTFHRFLLFLPFYCEISIHIIFLEPLVNNPCALFK